MGSRRRGDTLIREEKGSIASQERGVGTAPSQRMQPKVYGKRRRTINQREEQRCQ